MRVVFAGLTVCALCFGAASGRGLPQATCGGWQTVATIVETGRTEQGSLTAQFRETLDAASGRYAAARDYGVFTEGEGFDGSVAWSRDRSHASHALDSVPAREIAVSEAWVRARRWCGASDARVEPLPDEKDGATVETVRRVTPVNGTAVLLRFDATSGVLRNSEVQLWEGRLIRHYEDWRRIRGALIAFAERDEYPEDEDVETIKLASAVVGKRVRPPATFAEPPRPRDYAILDGASSTTVPYEDDGIARIFVPVFIDGKGPFTFEVDTGGHLILTSGTAAQLRMTAVGSFNGTGGGTGIVKEGIVPIHEVRIGAAVLREQVAKVVPLSNASNDRGSRAPRAGILGLELFERFAVMLDRQAKTLVLTPLEEFRPPARGTALPLFFTEDAPETRGSFEGVAGDFELDTGDAGPAIVEGYWATEHRLDHALSHGLVWLGAGVGGEYKETLSRGDITLGPIRLPREVVSYVGVVPRGSESTKLQAGLVGESSLYRFDVSFDYGHEQVWLETAPGVPPHAFDRSGLRLKKDGADRFAAALVLPGTPAAEAGIAVGDEILVIDGTSPASLSTTDVFLLLSGPVGSDVVLHVVPKGGGAPRDVHIKLRELLP